MCRQCTNNAPDYPEVYESFWKKIVENEDGTLNKDQVMRELYDFHHLIEQVPTVYSHVTGHRMSYHTYWAHDVNSVHDEVRQNDNEEHAAEQFAEFIDWNPDMEPMVREFATDYVALPGLAEAIERQKKYRAMADKYNQTRGIEEDPED